MQSSKLVIGASTFFSLKITFLSFFLWCCLCGCVQYLKSALHQCLLSFLSLSFFYVWLVSVDVVIYICTVFLWHLCLVSSHMERVTLLSFFLVVTTFVLFFLTTPHLSYSLRFGHKLSFKCFVLRMFFFWNLLMELNLRICFRMLPSIVLINHPCHFLVG